MHHISRRPDLLKHRHGFLRHKIRIRCPGNELSEKLHVMILKGGADAIRARGIGVFTVDGKMIDIAFYDGAKRTIELAKASGVYKGDL